MKNRQRLFFLVVSTIIIVTVFCKIKTDSAKIKTVDMTTTTTIKIVTTELIEPSNESVSEQKVEREVEEEKRVVESVSETKQEIVTEVKIEQTTAVASNSNLYTEDEIIMLAKLVYAEAGNIPSDTEQSCVIWTVLNRVDSSVYPNTIAACITQPSQFAYRSSTKVTDHCLWLARDVVSRWERERAGETNVGRTLPQGYFSFWGDGRHNYFRVGCGDQNYWNYSYGTPYAS